MTKKVIKVLSIHWEENWFPERKVSEILCKNHQSAVCSWFLSRVGQNYLLF